MNGRYSTVTASWRKKHQVPRLRMSYASLHSCSARDDSVGKPPHKRSFRLPWMAYSNQCRAQSFRLPRITTVKGVSRFARGFHMHAYPAAIMGTAARAAIIPTVFQRVNRSPKKMRARMTVSAG